jgi:hypothetical protein
MRGLLCLVVVLPCAAAGPPAQERPRPEQPMPRTASPRTAQAAGLPSSVLGGSGVESKIKVTSTDAQGNCPNGATKLDKCSGVYPNGNSWEISPCCRIETD